MTTLYEVLDEFCRNKKSGKIMPSKNWPKPNTKIVRSVNHDPDETSPEIIKVLFGGKAIMSTYQDGRITLHAKFGKVVRDRINTFLNLSDTGWTVGGYYGPWYMCYNGQKVQKYEADITIEPAPKKDWSEAKDGDLAVCFYCSCEIAYDQGGVYWRILHEIDKQNGDPSYCVNGWQHDHGRWHYPAWMENDGTGNGGSGRSTLWDEAPDGDYSMGDVSKCQYCKQEITLAAYGREHLTWQSTYGESWCGRSPTMYHPAGEGTWHHPNGEVVRKSPGQPQEFPVPRKPKAKPKVAAGTWTIKEADPEFEKLLAEEEQIELQASRLYLALKIQDLIDTPKKGESYNTFAMKKHVTKLKEGQDPAWTIDWPKWYMNHGIEPGYIVAAKPKNCKFT